jgi:hypothetical protein
MILETTLEGPFVPGSNVVRPVTDASWLLLLPTLQLGTVIVVGDPGEEVLHGLNVFAAQVVRVDRVRELDQRVDRECDVLVLATVPSAAPMIETRLAVWSRFSRRRAPHDGSSGVWFVRADEAVAPTGDAGGWVGFPFGPSRRTSSLGPLVVVRGRAWRMADRVGRRLAAVIPGKGDGDAVLSSTAPRRVGDPDRGNSSLAVSARPGASQPKSVLQFVGGARPTDLPAWVREVAAQHGIDVTARPWTVNFDADYRSQKVMFRVGAAAPDSPDLVIKVTRDPQFSSRLINEYRGLTLLQGLEAAGHAPAPLFAGEHCGLAVVGETALDGSPFSAATNFTPTCVNLARVIEWALMLGREPARCSTASGVEVVDALERLLSQYRQNCAPSATGRAAVERDIAAVAELGAVPTVLMHGDLGTWNVLITRDGDVGVLDWENTDPRGLPCWDLAYLIMSHAQRSQTARGRRFTASSAVAQFEPGSAWHVLLTGACARATSDAGLPPSLAAPLVRLSWVHLAVKSATRRPAGEGDASFHARLLEIVGRRTNGSSLFG